MSAMADESSAGVSPWERALYKHLVSHVETERGLLESYRAAAQESPSKALRYLINLLIEDEVRHHRLFGELASSLRAESMLGGEEAAVPPMDFDRDNHEEVVALTDSLLAKELEDQVELRRLRKEMRLVEDTTLWTLLVELMERDTQKHIAILRFAKRHAKRGR